MAYTLVPDAERDIVEIVYSGAITAQTLRAATAEALALQKRTGALNFLINADGWDLSASLVDVYELPAKTYWQEDLDRRTRIALIRPHAASAEQGALFFQDACRNRGWNARVFDNRAAAIDWLSKREAVPK